LRGRHDKEHMSTQISEVLGDITITADHGAPTHVTPVGSIYTDLDTGMVYARKQVDAATVSWIAFGVAAAGNDTEVQFNDGGTFGGDAGLTYDKTTATLGATNVQASAVEATTVDATAFKVGGATPLTAVLDCGQLGTITVVSGVITASTIPPVAP
jgi:hypothetical protein